MSSKLQLTILAVLVSAALPAQAALYKVVEVAPGVSGNEVYGTAIQPSGSDASCFDSGASSATCEGYKLAGETRNRPDGFSYREEVPFAMDNSFGYIEDDYDGFEDYCFYQLGYATCEYWASDRWSSWYNETYSSNTPNSLAFIEGSAEKPSGAINTVINSLDPSGQPVGNFSTSSKRNEAFSAVTNSTLTSKAQSRAWASDGTYTVGSTSSKSGIGGERYYYSSAPAIWSASGFVSIPRAGGYEVDGDYYAQGSMRDFYIDSAGGKTYGVGYNNYSDQHMNATIFIGNSATPTSATWSSALIYNAQVDISGDNINSNSVATNINKNLVVVGQAKRSGGFPQNGAASNRLFIVPDASASSINASFFYGGIFFDGAGGEMGGINNFNEIVGRIDSENHREYDGKQRRQRAFIYPYGMTPKTDSSEETAITARRAIFKNKAWLLDDLTNGGSESSNNNQYRIYDASDINDAGVISATAVKCSGGYDSTSHNAYCGDGNGTEKVVAVKLVPIAGADASAIQPRSYDSTATERKGAGLGFGALTILGLFGFMRKRIK
ncbi:hypothetical protein BEI46_14095 [Aliivibrio fischeri]|uniref:DUF3466 family protein n=1 Tax=Aliivibrio fischeri TaxID=668 RepID=UPI00084C89E0|nr:DUF3466 family protein [Aliivibrio fischeri]OED54662.1 hypothetical protein BEI46_14095 [Aliivibrio fischeri]